jgi:hypothetical protein
MSLIELTLAPYQNPKTGSEIAANFNVRRVVSWDFVYLGPLAADRI